MATVQSTIQTLDLEPTPDRTPGRTEFELKEFIKLHWGDDAITGSGDGLALFSTSADVITISGSGAGGMGNNNAWWACSLPDDTLHFVRQLFDVATSSPDTRMKVSSGAGGAFTGGAASATQVPTAIGEEVHHGGGTDAAPTGINTHPQATGADDRRIMAAITTAAPYIFWGLVIESFTTYRPDPFCFYIDHVQPMLDHDNVEIPDSFPKVVFQQAQFAALDRTEMLQSGADSSQSVIGGWLDGTYKQMSLWRGAAESTWPADPTLGRPFSPCVYNVRASSPAPNGFKGFSTAIYHSAQGGDQFYESYKVRGVANAMIRFNDFALIWGGPKPPTDSQANAWTEVDCNLMHARDTIFVDTGGLKTILSRVQSFDTGDIGTGGAGTYSPGLVEFELKEFLKLHWGDDVITASGDGLALFSTSTDVITIPGGGAGGMNNIGAWWACSLPDDTLHFVRQFVDTITQVRVKASKGAGGAFTTGGAPSATQVPSGVGEIVIIGEGTDAAPLPTAGATHPGAGGAERRLMGSITDSAPYQFCWWVFDRFSDNRCRFAFIVDHVETVIGGDGPAVDTAPKMISQNIFDGLLRSEMVQALGERSFAWLDDGGGSEGPTSISHDHLFSTGANTDHPINGNPCLYRPKLFAQVSTPDPDGQKGVSSIFASYQSSSTVHHRTFRIKGISHAMILVEDYGVLWTLGQPVADDLAWVEFDANLLEFQQGVFIEAATPFVASPRSVQPIRGGKLVTLRDARSRPRGPIS